MRNITNNKYIKLICGAGNENIKEIEALSFIYSSAGFNMIDVAAKNDVIKAAKNGIIKAQKQDEVLLCVSVGLQSDIHLSKAVINKQKCIQCGKCLTECPQNAIYSEDGKIQINEKNCIGCLKCVNVCENEAIITEHKYKTPCNMLLSVLSEDIDCVEFHCNSPDVPLILDNWKQIKSVYNGQLGFCLDRSKLSDDKIISLIRTMTEGTPNIIIQADGKPMSGGTDDYKSNLQALAFAELIRNNGITSPVIVSGGTNSKTTEMAKLCNLDIDGVAIGSFARKLVKEEICNPDFFDNYKLQENAIQKAKLLYNNLNMYLQVTKS